MAITKLKDIGTGHVNYSVYGGLSTDVTELKATYGVGKVNKAYTHSRFETEDTGEEWRYEAGSDTWYLQA